MRNLTYALALIWVRSALCKLAIDIKLGVISRGVIVHYGTFGQGGRYRMFIGEREALECVEFGNKVIYPSECPAGLKYQIIAETFEIGYKKFVVINSFGLAEGVQFGSSRHIYEVAGESFRRTNEYYLLNSIGDVIYLSVDIGPRPRHPFIVTTVTEGSTKRFIDFSTLKFFNGFQLDGLEGPIYAIGPVYDSSTTPVVGYTETQILAEKCTKLTVEFGTEPEKVIADMGHLMLTYEKRYILKSPVWYLTGKPEHGILPDPISKALAIYDKILKSKVTFSPITLDISEQISPQVFGIERSVGFINGWSYVVYELKSKHQQDQVIKYIIDSDVEEMTIFKVDSKCVQVNVEIFKRKTQIYVVITSHIKVSATYIREIELFERKQHSRIGYARIEDPRKTGILGSIAEKFPIVMDMNISEEPKFFYDFTYVGNESMRFQFFQIKETDAFGNKLPIKYIFGNIWENDPYEYGNTPREHINKDSRLVKESLNVHKFLLRETPSGPPLLAEQYEVYPKAS